MKCIARKELQDGNSNVVARQGQCSLWSASASPSRALQLFTDKSNEEWSAYQDSRVVLLTLKKFEHLC